MTNSTKSGMTNARVIQRINAAIGSARFYTMNFDVGELPFVPITSRKFAKDMPPIACIYFITDANGKVYYVGKTVNLPSRWQGGHHCLDRALEGTNFNLAWLEVAPRDLTIIEALMIRNYSPEWNQSEKREDGDDYLRNDPKRFEDIWET